MSDNNVTLNIFTDIKMAMFDTRRHFYNRTRAIVTTNVENEAEIVDFFYR